MALFENIFGPPKDEIWKQIANEIDGEFIDQGFWGKDMLTFKYKEWELLLDTFSRKTGKTTTTYTRFRVPFVNRNNFKFTIYREGFFASIGKFFGMQDIQIGDSFFDEEFIIKSNDVNKVKYLLSDKELKKLFKEQNYVNFTIKEDAGWFSQKYPAGVRVLYFETSGIITNKDVLHGLFQLFMAILDRLVYINAAYEKNPNFKF